LAVFQEVIRLDPTDSERHVRVLDLREQVEARRAAAARASADGPAARPWDDPEAAARDLDWDRASVQEDSSSAEEDLLPAPESEPEPWASRKEEWLSRQEPGAVAPVESEAGPLSGLGFVDHPGLLWVAKDGEGAPAGPEDVLATRTLGELYLSQGLPRKAEEVYAGLVARDPGNRALEARLSEIRDLLGGRPAGHVQELSAEVETPAEEAPPELVAPVEGAALAAATPATEAAPGLVLPVVGPPAHLALPVAELAPASILLVEDLAPARLLPIEELAPALVVPVGELAPALVVPVGELAPALVVPVGELAPELPVFLSAPAPDTRLVADSAAFDFPTPSGSAAQPQRGDEATPTEDHVLDAFEIWLKGLE
jgi:hypothetical protein